MTVTGSNTYAILLEGKIEDESAAQREYNTFRSPYIWNDDKIIYKGRGVPVSTVLGELEIGEQDGYTLLLLRLRSGIDKRLKKKAEKALLKFPLTVETLRYLNYFTLLKKLLEHRFFEKINKSIWKFDIIAFAQNKERIKEKEKEYISKYGRRYTSEEVLNFIDRYKKEFVFPYVLIIGEKTQEATILAKGVIKSKYDELIHLLTREFQRIEKELPRLRRPHLSSKLEYGIISETALSLSKFYQNTLNFFKVTKTIASNPFTHIYMRDPSYALTHVSISKLFGKTYVSAASYSLLYGIEELPPAVYSYMETIYNFISKAGVIVDG